MPGTVLVVGATGFIGGHAAESIEAAGGRVIGTSRSGDGADLACDLSNPDSIDRAVSVSQPDAILIAAGQASVAEAWRDPSGTFLANTAGPFNLLDSARRLAPESHIVFASSAGVYGSRPTAIRPDPESMPFIETDPVRPASPYGASKAAAEMFCHQFSRQCGMTVTIARIFNQIGPGQDDAQAPAEFSREIAQAEGRGERAVDLPVGNPAAERDFTDVRDTARAFTAIVEQRLSGLFNLCSGVGVSLESMIDGLRSGTEVELRIVERPGPPRPADIPLVYGSHDKLTEAIGWEPSIPLESSLSDLLDDWRSRV